MYDRYVCFNLSPHGELSPSPHHALEDMLPLPVRIVSLFPGWNLALRYSMKSSYKNHEFRDDSVSQRPLGLCETDVGVSKNRGTPKWMVYNGKPY